MSLILRGDISRRLTIPEMDGNFLYLEDLALTVVGATGARGATGASGSITTVLVTTYLPGATGPQGSQGVPGPIACPLQICDGSAAAPAYSFSADTNTGMFRQGNDIIGFGIGGAEYFRMNASGNFLAYADVIAFSSTLSDKRLKNNVSSLSNSLEIINKLRPVSYTWDKKLNRQGTDFGLIAQEVEEVVPQAVAEYHEMNSGAIYKNIKHERLIPYLVGAIQTLQLRIEELEKKL